jgi:hypothetical protein
MCNLRMIILTLLLVASSGAAQAAIISTFDNDAEGWTHGRGDPNSQVVWSATGGNLGGCLTLVDQAAGNTDYWQAPAKFLGDLSNTYLGTLSFDLKLDTAGTVFSDFDVIITGSGHQLGGLFDVTPSSTTYNTFSIVLQEGPKWYYDGSVFGPPSIDKFQNVLADVTSLQIRGDFLNALEVDSLDNVVLTPEPGYLTLLSAALLIWRCRRSGGRCDR